MTKPKTPDWRKILKRRLLKQGHGPEGALGLAVSLLLEPGQLRRVNELLRGAPLAKEKR